MHERILLDLDRQQEQAKTWKCRVGPCGKHARRMVGLFFPLLTRIMCVTPNGPAIFTKSRILFDLAINPLSHSHLFSVK